MGRDSERPGVGAGLPRGLEQDTHQLHHTADESHPTDQHAARRLQAEPADETLLAAIGNQKELPRASLLDRHSIFDTLRLYLGHGA